MEHGTTLHILKTKLSDTTFYLSDPTCKALRASCDEGVAGPRMVNTFNIIMTMKTDAYENVRPAKKKSQVTTNISPEVLQIFSICDIWIKFSKQLI